MTVAKEERNDPFFRPISRLGSVAIVVSTRFSSLEGVREQVKSRLSCNVHGDPAILFIQGGIRVVGHSSGTFRDSGNSPFSKNLSVGKENFGIALKYV